MNININIYIYIYIYRKYIVYFFVIICVCRFVFISIKFIFLIDSIVFECLLIFIPVCAQIYIQTQTCICTYIHSFIHIPTHIILSYQP